MAIGYLSDRGQGYRWVLGLLSAPVAIGVNCLRVFGTGLIMLNFGAEWATGKAHEYEGLVMLGVAALLLFGLAWLLALVWMWVLHAMRGMTPGPAALMLLGLAKLLDFALVMAMLLIVLRALLSLFGGGFDSPILPVLAQLTDPLLRPIQRVIPALGGFDFSPLVAILAITLLRILVVRPLFDLAVRGAL